jgi:hypothetical protein
VTRALTAPLRLLVSVAGGLLAGAVFNRVWKAVAHENEAPEPTDRDRSWREVLAAAALHGAVYGLVKAAVDRGAARGVDRAKAAMS